MAPQKSFLKTLPKTPGVYEFFNSAGEILYVGKAKNLKSRVSQYFLKSTTEPPKTQHLVPQIASVKTIGTRSEFEALLLEAKLIHEYRPKYNVLARDDKSPLYLAITLGEKLPRVLFIRRPKTPTTGADKTIYFGPFQSPKATRTLLRRLRVVVPYCTQKQRTGKPCFYTQLGLCTPCPSYIVGLPSGTSEARAQTTAYRRNIRRLVSILSGKTRVVISELEREIRVFAKRLEYERASQTKEHLDALLFLLEAPLDPSWYTQRDTLAQERYQQEAQALRSALGPYLAAPLEDIKRIECFDVSNLYGSHPTASMVTAVEGVMDPSWYRRFHIRTKATPNDVAMMHEAITRRLAHTEWPAPALLLVDGGKGQVAAATLALAQSNRTLPVIGLAKRFEQIIVPQGGDLYKTITLPLDSPALHLLRRVRDEAHRFALAYHRKLRKKASGL
jgi:excinuclease ABC subunit C